MNQLHVRDGPVVPVGVNVGNVRHDVATAGDASKHRVNAVQPTGTFPVVAVVRDKEELAASRVRGACLRHGDGADLVLEPVVRLIWNGVCGRTAICFRNRIVTVAIAEPLCSVPACTVAVGEIAPLNHEVVNDSMEDGVVVIAVLDQEFEVLDVNGSLVWIQLNGHRTRVGTTVPTEFQLNDVGGRVRLVGHVDERQNQHARHENSNDARRRWRAVVEKPRECGLADALVLHFVEQIVVQTACFLVTRVLFGGFTKQRGCLAVGSSVVACFRLQPGRMACEAQGRLFLAFRVNFTKNFQRSITFSFGNGLLCLVPSCCDGVIRHVTPSHGVVLSLTLNDPARRTGISCEGEWVGNMLKGCM